jgi:hypothetical protein
MLELESKEFIIGSKSHFIIKFLLLLILAFGISFSMIYYLDDILGIDTMISLGISIPAVFLLWYIPGLFIYKKKFHVLYHFCYNTVSEVTFSVQTGFTQNKVCDLTTIDMLALKKSRFGSWSLIIILTNYDIRLKYHPVVIKSRNKKFLIKLGKKVSRDFDKFFRF